MIALAECVRCLDELLKPADTPDYDRAKNGLQLQNTGAVTRVAVAVDYCLEAVQGAANAQANLLLVHHGMFWSEPQSIVGSRYDRLRAAIQHDIAVYASHLPLDVHPTLGNNALLADALGLVPDRPFGTFKSIAVGTSGASGLLTAELVSRVRAFAEPLGSRVVSTPFSAGRRCARWAIVTGAGASSETLREAAAAEVDTLIVGEGPHHAAVEARERDIVVVFAGHYASETLGVQALGRELNRRFGLPWSFVHVPTGL